MNYFKPFVLLLSLLFLYSLFSCKKDDQKNISPLLGKYISAFTSGNISNMDDIEIIFAQDVPYAKAGDKIPDGLLKFSPAIKGSGIWTSPSSLVFKPEENILKAGKTYNVTCNLDQLFKVSSELKRFFFSFKVYEQFYELTLSPYTPLHDVNGYRDNNMEWNKVEGRLVLSNALSSQYLTELTSMINISDTKKSRQKAIVSIMPTDAKNIYQVLIDSLQRTSQPNSYEIKVDGKKIDAVNGNKSYKIELPAINEFKVLSAEIKATSQAYIQIVFSDLLDKKQNINQAIKVNGTSNFAYEIKNNIINIYADNLRSNETKLEVSAGILNINGKNMADNQIYNLSFLPGEPSIELLNKFSILPKSDGTIFYFKANNLWAVDVQIIKIFEDNILAYFQNNNYGENNNLRRFGKLVAKKIIRLDDNPSLALDKWNIFPLDVSELFEQEPGALYQLEFKMRKEYFIYNCEKDMLSSHERNEAARKIMQEPVSLAEAEFWDTPPNFTYDGGYYGWTDWSDYNWQERNNPCSKSFYVDRQKNAFILSSNLGILAKKGEENDYLVAVSDLISTKPVQGAKVEAYSYQLQKMDEVKTNNEGFATLNIQNGMPFLIKVSKESDGNSNYGDANYLKVLPNLSLSLSNFDVGGTTLQKGMQAYIYGERGVWRPGDSIYLTMIVDSKINEIPEGLPATLKLTTPRGEKFKEYISYGNHGFYSFKMATLPSSETGLWSANINIGGSHFNKGLRIESIKPNRLKITLDTEKSINATMKEINFSLSSQWLMGTPASNLKAQVEMVLSSSTTSFKNYPDYAFSSSLFTFNQKSIQVFNGILNEKGEASFFMALPKTENAPGMLNARLITRVYENGGDASIAIQDIPYSPFTSYVGLKLPFSSNANMGNDYLLSGEKYNMQLITVNNKGEAISIPKVNVKIYRVGWSWWWSNNQSSLSSFISNSKAEIVFNETVSTKNKATNLSFTVPNANWGKFLVVATDESSGHIATQTFLAYNTSYIGQTDENKTSSETMLVFKPSKDKYNVGETAEIILPASSNGHALVTLENGYEVLRHEWIKVSADSPTKYTFEIKPEMAPNVFVGVSLLQPYAQDNNNLPIRLYGIANIKVENTSSILMPVINMPDELKPEKDYTIDISEANGQPMTYTLAVVDEGLLDLTSFKTPNAWTEFYANQALGVRTWDIYDYVLGKETGKIGPILRIGGDRDLKPTTETVKRFNPVVEYMGPFNLAKGKVQKHKLHMPSYYGSVRVMVVAGNQQTNAYGSTQKTVEVKNSLMIIASLPRSLTPNEEIQIPVNVFYLGDKQQTANITISAQNKLLEITGDKTQSISFDGKGDKTIYFNAKVSDDTGWESIKIKGVADSDIASETVDIEIKNPNPYIIKQDEATLNPGDSISLNIALSNIGDRDWCKLQVSRMPGLDLAKVTEYLFTYPYNCTEQIISIALPSLFLDKFKSLSDKERADLSQNVRIAIETLNTRQKANGGFAMWPNDNYASEWISTYALQFLLLAEKEGYVIPQMMIQKALQFTRAITQNWQNNNLDSSFYDKSQSDLQQAYRLYVLALANTPDATAMNKLRDNKNISTIARWRLADAYAIIGKKDVAKEILSGTGKNLPNVANDTTFGNSVRNLAMILETEISLGDFNSAVKTAQQIAPMLSNSNYMTTQSAAFGLMAMMQLTEKIGSSPFSVEWYAGKNQQGKIIDTSTVAEVDIRPAKDVKVSLINTGESVVYATLTYSMQPLEGSKKNEENGLQINCQYLGVDSQPIEITKLKQGEEFYALVSVRNMYAQTLTDLALTQTFASGWEIYNEGFIQRDNGKLNYIYQDVRDNSVCTFFNIGPNETKTFKIRLRASYVGRFYLPSVRCESMYQPNIWGETACQWVEVMNAKN